MQKALENRPEWMIVKVVPVIPPELRHWYHLMVVVLQLLI
jgi:DNA-directed RNA polymerase beta' subunit